MTRTKVLGAAAVLFAAALGASGQNPPARVFGIPAQPKGPAAGFGRPLPLKGLGKTPEQSPQASAKTWTDRLFADLEQLKLEVNRPRIPAAAKKALTDRVDAALGQADALEKVLGQNNRNQWYRAYGELEAALAELGKAVGQHAGNVPAVVADWDRVNYDSQQIGVAIAAGDNNADQVKRVIARLAGAQEAQAERLRALVEGLGPAAQPLERQTRQFVRVAQQFNKSTANAAVDLLRKEFATVATEWQDVLAAVGRAANLPPPVRYQSTRVDGLNRRLAEVLGFNPPPILQPPPLPRKMSVLAVGAGREMAPRVVVYADGNADATQSFYAFNRVTARDGVRVSVADLNGDGMPEVVTTHGAKGPARVRVFDGRDMSVLLWFDAFGQKTVADGYFVAAADLTRDGRALVAIAPDVGGPPVAEVYDLTQGKLVAAVEPFPRGFTGGVRLAWGDVNGDGAPDLVTASGPGEIATEVKVFDGTNFTKVLSEFLVVTEKYKSGAWVAAADLSKGDRAEIVIGLDTGARPLVRLFNGRGKLLSEFEPYPNTFRGGVRVAIGNPDEGAKVKIICAPGPGGPRDLPVRIFGPDGKVVSELDPFPNSNSGMFVDSR
jgi:hypothetical protein